MNCKVLRKLSMIVVILVCFTIMVAPSFAANVVIDMKAEARDVTMPDTTIIPMWGFFLTTDAGTAWTPGPTLNGLVAGDTLTINLTNNLPAGGPPVSIVIPGQPPPTVTGGIPAGVVTDLQGRPRITSFTGQADAGGGTVSYTWTPLKTGTYLYQSGSHPAVQVQMGLYGGVKIDAALGEAYLDPDPLTPPSYAYTNEAVLLYSEIDPDLHAAVAGGTYGVPPGPTSTLNYKPRYFLINGQPFQVGQLPLPAGNISEPLLMRFLNAGLRSHVPTLFNNYMKLIAEDGNLYPYPKEQYSFLLAAGKTLDALWTPASAGTYALYDRSQHLTTGVLPGGGMLAKLEVAAPVPPAPPNPPLVAVNDIATTNGAGVIIRLLDNDSGTGIDSATVKIVSKPKKGNAKVQSDGTVTYKPKKKFKGREIFKYTVKDKHGVTSNQATVTVDVKP